MLSVESSDFGRRLILGLVLCDSHGTPPIGNLTLPSVRSSRDPCTLPRYSRQDWERQALKMIHDLEAVGRRVQKVPINVEALITWCAKRKCRIDMAARSEYVSYLLSQGKNDAEAPPIAW